MKKVEEEETRRESMTEPSRYEKAARAQYSTSSMLGCTHKSGKAGRKGIEEKFFEKYGRNPTKEEVIYGLKNGFSALTIKVLKEIGERGFADVEYEEEEGEEVQQEDHEADQEEEEDIGQEDRRPDSD